MTKEDVDSPNDADTDDADNKETVDSATEIDSEDSTETDSAQDDVESSDDEAPSSDDDKASSAGASWLRYAAIGALAAVLIGALVLSGIVGSKVWRQHQIDAAGEQALAVAIPYTETLTSIDSNDIDESFRRILNGATGDLKKDFTPASVQLRQLLLDNKATSHGKIVNSAIQYKSTDKVVLLMMVDQSITNTQRPDPRVDKSRMKITMEKIDGRWLASKLEYL
ncbi:Mce-associated membrane protein [Mycobacteroides chelonae]|nr:Mce-associated membrane protein [Mycobacteroides chelonae]